MEHIRQVQGVSRSSARGDSRGTDQDGVSDESKAYTLLSRAHHGYRWSLSFFYTRRNPQI
jgi:hypothetical protein